jgi:hypothetical protein
VWQANFLFHMAFRIQKRKLACRTPYKTAGVNHLGVWYLQKKKDHQGNKCEDLGGKEGHQKKI